MKAQELKQKMLKKKYQDKVTVIGGLPDGNFYHIHDDEELPKDEHIRIFFKVK